MGVVPVRGFMKALDFTTYKLVFYLSEKVLAINRKFLLISAELDDISSL